MLTINFDPFPDLSTARLLLRQIAKTDAEAIRRIRSNEEVMRYINRPLTLSIEDAEKWIDVVTEVLTTSNGISWCIALKEAPLQHIGNIGLWRIEKENHRAEIGYMLEPAFQNKGIMSEAIQQVIDYGFNILKLHSIEGKLDPRNTASAMLLKKAGFVQEGYFKENYRVGETFADTAVYSLLTPLREDQNKL